MATPDLLGVRQLHNAIFRAIEPDAEDLGTDETYGEAVERVLRRELPAIYEHWMTGVESPEATYAAARSLFNDCDEPDYESGPRHWMEAARHAVKAALAASPASPEQEGRP